MADRRKPERYVLVRCAITAGMECRNGPGLAPIRTKKCGISGALAGWRGNHSALTGGASLRCARPYP